nr:hypothetical protein KitaXyl93_76970 [Kitasatospora sp. Xyl93]
MELTGLVALPPSPGGVLEHHGDGPLTDLRLRNVGELEDAGLTAGGLERDWPGYIRGMIADSKIRTA